MAPGSRTRVVGIASGKGGVGKSSVTVNLAVALAAAGPRCRAARRRRLRLLGAEMLGVDRGPVAIDDLLVPPVVHGVRCLSMGFFVPDDQPVIWRGRCCTRRSSSSSSTSYWGEPDFLLVDMPPGTGDVALVDRPVPAADRDLRGDHAAARRPARRPALGLRGARSSSLPLRGVIENMSWFTGDDGARYELFGAGGGQALADELEVPLLGRVPLVPDVRVGWRRRRAGSCRRPRRRGGPALRLAGHVARRRSARPASTAASSTSADFADGLVPTSRPTRRASRLLDPTLQLRSLRLLHAGHLDIPSAVGRAERGRGLEMGPAEEDDISRKRRRRLFQ